MRVSLTTEERQIKKRIDALFEEAGLKFIKSPSNEMCSVEIKDIDSYFYITALIRKIIPSKMLAFRGQGDRVPPTPRIARDCFQKRNTRYKNPEGFVDREAEIQKWLRSELKTFIGHADNSFHNATIQEFMERCQHYGFPTRLLDTTEDETIALFFANEAFASGKEEAFIYIYLIDDSMKDDELQDYLINQAETVSESLLAPVSLSVERYYQNRDMKLTEVKKEQFVRKVTTFYKTRSIIYLQSRLDDVRVHNQCASFLLFGNQMISGDNGLYKSQVELLWQSQNPTNDFYFVRNQLQRPYKGNVIRITIKSDAREEIKRYLIAKGIDANRIYPSLESFFLSCVDKIKYQLQNGNGVF